ncbi:MAG: iron-containing alcohol dehydrogenase family protein [Candidatus Gastranaerophilaceae bacterium]|jgi:glycerol-1-phosphate dehydrogenase [NAD(P)+]
MHKAIKQINIPSLLKIGDGKLPKLGKYLSDRDYVNVALFYSEGIEDLVGSVIQEGLLKYGINITHKNTINDINIENVIHTAFKIPKETTVLLGIGGGKALDYSKYCAHVLSLPFISVPTSTSNDGFCSPNASLLVEGKRQSVKATIPYGVVVDLDFIKSSPEICIFSGLGDLISKITALWDWKQAFLKKLDFYNDFAGIISANSVQLFYNYQFTDITNKEFLYNLSNSLLMSGIAMEICGSSRPASGSEHLISHALDKISANPRIHGIQVGIATYLCSILQNNQACKVKDFLINTGFVDYVQQDPLSKEEFLEAIIVAPTMKQSYYTILSEPDAIKNAVELVNNEDLLGLMIK